MSGSSPFQDQRTLTLADEVSTSVFVVLIGHRINRDVREDTVSNEVLFVLCICYSEVLRRNVKLHTVRSQHFIYPLLD